MTRWSGVRSVRTSPAVALVLTGLAGLTACGTRHASADGNACLTAVHGVASGSGVLATTWLPAGFHQSSGDGFASALPSATYAKTSARHDAPRLRLNASYYRGPLRTAAPSGRALIQVVIEGHHALVASGAPDPRAISVYWKPSGGYLLAAGGYKLSPQAMLRAARHVIFKPPGTISLPIVPGPIVSRKAAEAAAQRSAQGPFSRAGTKLSSWTEVATLFAAHTGRDAPDAPALLRAAPWQPVWVVLADRVVVIRAATGRVVATMKPGATWFAALTDRDPAAGGGC